MRLSLDCVSWERNKQILKIEFRWDDGMQLFCHFKEPHTIDPRNCIFKFRAEAFGARKKKLNSPFQLRPQMVRLTPRVEPRAKEKKTATTTTTDPKLDQSWALAAHETTKRHNESQETKRLRSFLLFFDLERFRKRAARVWRTKRSSFSWI